MQTQAFEMLKQISQDLSSHKWLSTQSISFSLLSATEYVKRFVKEIDDVNVDVKTASSSEKVNISKTIYQQEIKVVDGKTNVRITNHSRSNLFVRQINSSAPYGVS
jgi:hypothetical protein